MSLSDHPTRFALLRSPLVSKPKMVAIHVIQWGIESAVLSRRLLAELNSVTRSDNTHIAAGVLNESQKAASKSVFDFSSASSSCWSVASSLPFALLTYDSWQIHALQEGVVPHVFIGRCSSSEFFSHLYAVLPRSQQETNV